MRHFLFALLSLTLAACASINPINPTSTVYTELELIESPSETPIAADIADAASEAPATPTLSILDEWLSAPETQNHLAAYGDFQPNPTPVSYKPLDAAELNCMALNMYFEARGEGERGMAAVGYIVLNRKADPKWPPKTICGIVHQGVKDARGRPVRNRCQFSWYCDGIPDRIHDQAMFAQAMDIAERVMRREIENPIGRSTHYHARRVNPSWSRRLVYHASIGAHRFYY